MEARLKCIYVKTDGHTEVGLSKAPGSRDDFSAATKLGLLEILPLTEEAMQFFKPGGTYIIEIRNLEHG